MIPLVDLAWQHAEIADDVRAGWEAVIADTAFVLGPHVERFEREFADFAGTAHCVGVANGTDAIELALRACDVRPGDEVIVPTNSFVATALAVARTGATPVLVDVDPSTHLVDPAAVERRLTPRTRAVVPVHLYGQLAPLERLAAVVGTRDVVIVEDAAQAHGASRNGMPAGRFGAAAAFSFYPGKNLGAYGDAGAVVTESDTLAARLRSLRNYGGTAKYEHTEAGFNSRLDSLQAVVLSAKLRHLDKWNAARRDVAARYDDLLASCPEIVLPRTAPGNEHVWHLYVVRVPDRDGVLARLHAYGVGAGIHYPTPIHLQPAFAHLGHRAGDFPVSEEAAASILSLPMHPGLSPEQQERVADALLRALLE